MKTGGDRQRPFWRCTVPHQVQTVLFIILLFVAASAPRATGFTSTRLATGEMQAGNFRLQSSSDGSGANESPPSKTKRIRRKLSDVLRQMPTTYDKQEAPFVQEEISEEKKSRISRLGDRIRSIGTEGPPSLSAQGIYQIKSDLQHR